MSLDNHELKPTGPTGPRTREGKAISSRNSWKTGIYARFRRFRTPEEAQDYAFLVEGFFDTWNPVGEGERANVHTLAYCQYWRLVFQAQECTLWASASQEMINLRSAQGKPCNQEAIESESLLCHGEREKELARRKRSISSEYNKAFRELIHLQRIRRQEAAAKARQANETTRVERKARQESEDRASATNESAEPASEFVSANPETPPETDL